MSDLERQILAEIAAREAEIAALSPWEGTREACAETRRLKRYGPRTCSSWIFGHHASDAAKMAFSRALSNLEVDEYISRASPWGGRRPTHAKLTDTGRALVASQGVTADE